MLTRARLITFGVLFLLMMIMASAIAYKNMLLDKAHYEIEKLEVESVVKDIKRVSDSFEDNQTIIFMKEKEVIHYEAIPTSIGTHTISID